MGLTNYPHSLKNGEEFEGDTPKHVLHITLTDITFYE
jgi:hypothetical protein